MNKHGFAPFVILLIVAGILIVVGITYYVLRGSTSSLQTASNNQPSQPEPVASSSANVPLNAPSSLATSSPSVNTETPGWLKYVYPSSTSGILPNISFNYPPSIGTPDYVSSAYVNTPSSVTADWGGFVDFDTYQGGEKFNPLRVEFSEKVNDQNSFQSYVNTIVARATPSSSVKYFKTAQYNVARARNISQSSWGSEVVWYYVQLPGNVVLSISTNGDIIPAYDDDAQGFSTRDKIIASMDITNSGSPMELYVNPKYHLLFDYPNNMTVSDNGLYTSKSGTQPSRLDDVTVSASDHQVLGVAVYNPSILSGNGGWPERPCGEWTFGPDNEPLSSTEGLLGGQKMLDVVSRGFGSGSSYITNEYYCVDYPANPTVLTFNQADKNQIQSILSSFTFQ